jgi:hypothetical protein
MTTTRPGRRLTWSRRLGIGISIGLVLFGALDATLPHSARPVGRITRVGSQTIPDSVVTTAATPVVSGQDRAALRVAEEFVAATNATDPTHPEGDTAERAALAPGLAVPPRVAWPEAWMAQHRQTTVILDPPGPVVAVDSGQVAVVITGRTVVTTDAGPSSEVPVDERITLHLTDQTGAASSSHWVVTGVGTGS